MTIPHGHYYYADGLSLPVVQENVTIFYRAELKMKTNFLVTAAGVPANDKAIKQVEAPQVRGFTPGGGNEGLPGLLEVDSEEAALMNAGARNAFLEWAADPEEGPASVRPLIAKEKIEEEGAYIPNYLKVGRKNHVSFTNSHYCYMIMNIYNAQVVS